jgi:hypothetical protein
MPSASSLRPESSKGRLLSVFSRLSDLVPFVAVVVETYREVPPEPEYSRRGMA